MSKNVVLVVMDTARASDTRYVREEISGSNLDRLATEGTDFRYAFSNSPWTLPSHTSIFTGTYTSKHGTHAGHKLYDRQFSTLAELLTVEGYETVGVTNNAWVTDEFGLARGFDEFYKAWQYFQSDTDFGEIKLTTSGTNLLKEGAKALFSGDVFANFVNGLYGQFFYRRSDYGAKRTNSIIRKWIEKRTKENPFFLFVNYLEPHLDYHPPKELAEQFLPASASYENAIDIPQKPWEYIAGNLEMSDYDFKLLHALYRAEIAYLDKKIGELRGILEENGEWEDTVFIVVGDHGENIGDHGLMDHQYSLNESLLHVPLLINGGSFNKVDETTRLIQTLDLFPTILDIADVSIPSQSQGISFYPGSATSPRDKIFAEYLSPQPTIDRLSKQTNTQREKLEKYNKQLRAIQTKRYKLIRDSDNTIGIHDLAGDTAESSGEAESNHSIRQELESELDSWLESFDHASTDESSDMSESTRQKLEDLGYLQ